MSANGGPPREEDAPCCQAKRDDDGRLPVGWCGPDCIRRPRNWRRLQQAAKR